LAVASTWMIGDRPSDWEAGLAAGVRVAAIVPDETAEKSRDRRLELGVRGYARLIDWLDDAAG